MGLREYVECSEGWPACSALAVAAFHSPAHLLQGSAVPNGAEGPVCCPSGTEVAQDIWGLQSTNWIPDHSPLTGTSGHWKVGVRGGEHQTKSGVSLLTNNFVQNPSRPSKVDASIPAWVQLHWGRWCVPTATTFCDTDALLLRDGVFLPHLASG